MLCKSIASLIRVEHARPGARFLENVDLEAYLAKLDAQAEFVAHSVAGECRAFVAYYCNDSRKKQAYITLVLVDQRHRRLGLGRALVACVLDISKRRGFTSCRLEVQKYNQPAHDMYLSMGFRPIEERPDKHLLEILL